MRYDGKAEGTEGAGRASACIAERMSRRAAGGIATACALAAGAMLCAFLCVGLAGAQDTDFAPASHEIDTGLLRARIAELTPDFATDAELLSGQVRLVGCDKPKSGTVDVKAASFCSVTAYFKLLPEVPSPFDRELLVSLDKIDIARVPILVERPRPGEVVKRELALYIPRHAPSGATTLRAGFVEQGSPGESRVELSWNMAPLISINVGPADPAPEMEPDRKRAMLNGVTRRDARNLVRNGGFEEALREWRIHENIVNGLDGWSKVLNIATDYEATIEGRTSLRIDFGGGQDPNFWHVEQDVTVRPNTGYLLTYFVKTENISSGQGPSMSIENRPEAGRDELYFATTKADRLTGTHDWTYIEIPFQTDAVTTAMLLRIRRIGSGMEKYDRERYGPVAGSVWFDGIRLIERYAAQYCESFVRRLQPRRNTGC